MTTKNSVDLTKAYTEAQSKILSSLKGNTPQEVRINFTKTLQTVVTSLDVANAQAVEQNVAGGIKASQGAFVQDMSQVFNGRAFTLKDLSDRGLNVKNQRIAEDVLQKKARYARDTAEYRQNFLELRGKLVGVSRGLQDDVNATLHNLSDNAENTLKRAVDELKDRLKSQGCLNVKYGNGASVGVDKYATMVCRSARTESANAENIRISKTFGTDLVECVGNAVTCGVCAQFCGRVFSISGKDKRYPPLRDGVNSPLKNGYDLIHPNCRCEFRAYFEALHSDEENELKRRFSNRPFTGDARTTEQARAYQEWQAVNRRAIDEQRRWNEMQVVLGKDNPYKDIGALRRALRSDEESFAYKKSHYAVRDYNQYERWKSILGKENVPETLADFQDLKYNKTDKFDVLQNYVQDEKVREQIRAEYPLTIQADKQGKHIRGSRTFIEGRSEIYLSVEECQEIVDKLSCKGKFQYDINGNWNHKEVVATERVIGCTVNLEGEKRETHCATIHYSKNGTHIVPYREK